MEDNNQKTFFKKKSVVIPLLAILSVAFIFAFVFAFNPQTPISENQVQGITHGDKWCAQIIRADGTVEAPYCAENTYTNAGKNATRDLLGGGSGTAAFDYIALGNTTSPTATDTTLGGEYAAGGLTRAQGTYYSLTQAGNWTISKTFTATADNLLVNTTALFNASSSGVMLAGFSFTDATLQTNDQITINATIWSA